MGHHRHSPGSMTKPPKEPESQARRHHIFTIELFLDETGKTSEIFIVHSQSGEKENLTSWEPVKVIDFIAGRTGLQAMNSTPAVLSSHRRHSPKIPNHHSQPETSSEPLASASLMGTPHIRKIEVTSIGSNAPKYVFPSAQPFTVHVTLDLTELTTPRRPTLICEATVIARQPGGPNITAAETRKRLDISGRNPTILVNSPGLPAGLYRLDALVKFSLVGTEHDDRQGAVAYLEGADLIEIY